MSKIKYTKTELKAQKDALARFERFLPMLQLKKQQLQIEIASIRAEIAEIENNLAQDERAVKEWVSLWSDQSAEIPLVLEEARIGMGNIAGVEIPVFGGLDASQGEIDLHESPAWVDEAVEVAERRLGWRWEIEVLRRQRELIEEELRTTAQRVNLFEKVKIPECRENIRIIRIQLGDEQTSAVARGKIAKGRDHGSAEMLLQEAAI